MAERAGAAEQAEAELHRDVEVWKVDRKAGLLRCDGQLPPGGGGPGKDGSHEMLRYDRELGDFVFHVEWRFRKVDDKTGYNSGVYVRSRPEGTVWVQVQVMAGRIANVTITRSTLQYPLRDIAGLPQQVVQRQTAQVDLVSRATYSSMAFRGAVSQALASATAA